MRSRFFLLVNQYPIKPSQKEALWQKVEAAHTQKHRRYHTLSHLAQMLDLLDTYQSEIQNPEYLAWTIWYHDIIYKPLRNDNEKQSAAYAKGDLSELLSFEALKTVEEYILATQQHAPTQDKDLQFLLDFDLWILGQDQDAYQIYTTQIRKEYRLVPLPLYRKGRKKVLQHFLAQPSIYQTPEFREKYEISAQRNLQNELDSLS
ncbi:MAG: hypothetical protein AAF740_12635 [Bacteroidota bacterium]